MFPSVSYTHLNPIKVAADKLKEGKIIAIKGIGGTHLVVDAYNDKAVKELRKRLNRPNQAFAVMSKDLDSVKGCLLYTSRCV